jgi:hypothetical protein
MTRGVMEGRQTGTGAFERACCRQQGIANDERKRG